jgi:DNA-directed RNA polymerase subunit K/omega
MNNRPGDVGAFEFVILASLRSAQLMRGCTPRVVAAEKCTITAQREVAAGMVVASERVVKIK